MTHLGAPGPELALARPGRVVWAGGDTRVGQHRRRDPAARGNAGENEQEVFSVSSPVGSETKEQNTWAGHVGVALGVALLVQCVVLVRLVMQRAEEWAELDWSSLPVVLVAGQLLALAAVGMTIWRLYLVATYRPVASVSDDELPELTVIVPAYNEGEQVLKTLRSLAASDYPLDKVRVVAVNDGSADDTWRWIQQGAREFPDLVVALNCPVNRGKRAALYEGFNRARGEVIVTVDSDSEVLPDTLRNLVSPFVRDSRVGAVAGNVRVLNREAGPIPAMLDVTFTYMFEFMRASESRVDTVFCTPGALSAYRRELIDACKDAWVAQTFCGRPANIGEDRALSNYVLRAGFLVHFQSNAIVLTEVPTRTPQLCRMVLRWARSDVRETLETASFLFRKFRPSSALGARVNLIWSILAQLVTPVLFVSVVLVVLRNPSTLGPIVGGALLSALLPALVFSLHRTPARALWAFPYALYNFFCLSWITPYALLTPHRSGWLTRKLPASGAAEAALGLGGAGASGPTR
jgi:hyaluronan synthase